MFRGRVERYSRFVSVIDRIAVIIRRHVSPIKRDRITSSFSKNDTSSWFRTFLLRRKDNRPRYKDLTMSRRKRNLWKKRNGSEKHNRKDDVGFNWTNGLGSSHITNTNCTRRILRLLPNKLDRYILCILRFSGHSSVRLPLLFSFIE